MLWQLGMPFLMFWMLSSIQCTEFRSDNGLDWRYGADYHLRYVLKCWPVGRVQGRRSMHQHYQELTKNKANYIPLSPLSFLARTADIFGERTAIVYEDRHYSWQQTYERSRALASALTHHGFGLGDTVSPSPSPRRVNAEASALARSYVCCQLYCRSSYTMAVRAPKISAVRAKKLSGDKGI